MITNKKGLSTVVTTLIIILLVLVAIGIIWVVVRGIIETGSEKINLDTMCLNTDVRVTNTTCASNSCTVKIYRKAGTDVLGGTALIFHSATESGVPQNVPGDITLLATKTQTGVSTNITTTPTSVDIVPYFKNEKGENQLCNQVNSYNTI